MQKYSKEREITNFPQQIYVREGERPTIKSLFEGLGVGDTLHIDYSSKLHNAIKQECFRQNEIARALGGELNMNFRTARKGGEILIYRLK